MNKEYDWSGMHTTGKSYLSGLAELVDEIPASVDQEDRLEEVFSEVSVRHFHQYKENDQSVFHFATDQYELEVYVSGNEPYEAEFTLHPFLRDGRLLYHGPLTSAAFDQTFLYEYLAYLFRTRKEALRTVAKDTNLSPREAEVFLLRQQGYDDETITTFMDITPSNLTTFTNRIADRVTEAEKDKEQADSTLRLLRNSWVLETKEKT
ncbi:hypothetical protein [Salinibaculum rarum]|uniref:hypothetical protein n=1 Tax=Salinibaculum rarum TaxID=3058903 RepID=UPI00265F98DE|nr:hypothetical protein [Salinibaculum sp. KK48]